MSAKKRQESIDKSLLVSLDESTAKLNELNYELDRIRLILFEYRDLPLSTYEAVGHLAQVDLERIEEQVNAVTHEITLVFAQMRRSGICWLKLTEDNLVYSKERIGRIKTVIDRKLKQAS